MPDPRRPVQSKQELEQALVAGLDSGEPQPVTPDDWESLRRRALANTEIRKNV